MLSIRMRQKIISEMKKKKLNEFCALLTLASKKNVSTNDGAAIIFLISAD